MSTRIISIHDRDRLAAFLRRDAPLHLYALGDLGDFFWPHTLWYGLERDGELQEVILGYMAPELLVLHALTSGPPDVMATLLVGVRHLLPPRVYAHLTPGLQDALAATYHIEDHGDYDKMQLVEPARIAEVDTTETQRLEPGDLAEIQALYAASYPGNWFDPRMLATGHYYGLREAGQLVSVAGVHVYAPTQAAAALGNIVTHPQARGRGYATIVTARLCRELLATVEQIGLNVRADNAVAIACYRRLGFVRSAGYKELNLTLAG
jgi:ribosomal protein S18 acetylase RimI-like enzyme